jgi:hypothetical protein
LDCEGKQFKGWRGGMAVRAEVDEHTYLEKSKRKMNSKTHTVDVVDITK